MLLGLLGEARSGKDTVANALEKEFNAEKLSFADPLKRIVCMNILGMTEEQVFGDLKETPDSKFGGKTPREIMQFMGTNAFRAVLPSVWTDYLKRNYLKRSYLNSGLGNPDKLFIITDVRFANEVQAVKELGGIVFKLKRAGGPGATGGIAGHASETELNTIPETEFAAVITAKSGDLPGLINAATTALITNAGIRGVKLL